MFSFLKKKVTPTEMGMGLHSFIEKADVDRLIDGSESLHQLSGPIGRDRLVGEILSLKIFALDVAVSMTLRDSNAKETVRDAFFNLLQERGYSLEGVHARLEKYDRAARQPHELGIQYSVGQVFAELCGMDKDALVIFEGTSIFNVFYKAVSDFLGSYKVSE